MKKKIKKTVQKVKEKTSGHRFLYAYNLLNKDISKKLWLKIILVLLGFCSLIFGFILLFIPGPGFLVILIGLVLWAILSERIAKFLDASEQFIRKHLWHKSNK